MMGTVRGAKVGDREGNRGGAGENPDGAGVRECRMIPIRELGRELALPEEEGGGRMSGVGRWSAGLRNWRGENREMNSGNRGKDVRRVNGDGGDALV